MFFLQFCIMRKLGQCGKYIQSLAIPLLTSFTVLLLGVFSNTGKKHNSLYIQVSFSCCGLFQIENHFNAMTDSFILQYQYLFLYL
jgi:hypothetical protein